MKNYNTLNTVTYLFFGFLQPKSFFYIYFLLLSNLKSVAPTKKVALLKNGVEVNAQRTFSREYSVLSKSSVSQNFLIHFEIAAQVKLSTNYFYNIFL